MDQNSHLSGSNHFGLSQNGTEKSKGFGKWDSMGEEKKAAVQAEIARVNKLPSNSGYAIHRMRVLNKLLHLMSIKRTISEDEELELLFATLSL